MDDPQSTLFPVLLPELVNVSQKLGERLSEVCVLQNWTLLAVHCTLERRKKIDIIRLSVQSEPHGSVCLTCSNKKARTPCRVTYSGGNAMKSHESDEQQWLRTSILPLHPSPVCS